MDFGKLDIGIKLAAAGTGAFLGAAAIIVPSGNQKKSMALDMYDKSWDNLNPQDQRAVEFAAGYKRWKGFVDNSIYSWTRKLPGADTPFVNPCRCYLVFASAQLQKPVALSPLLSMGPAGVHVSWPIAPLSLHWLWEEGGEGCHLVGGDVAT
jgi:hypothetical protein